MSCRRTVAVAALTALTLVMILSHRSPAAAQQPSAGEANGSPAETVARHLAAGEFDLARQAVDGVPAEQRGSMLAQIALGQAATGAGVASARTLTEISDPTLRTAALNDLQQGAAGGGSMADFGPLMQLISSTVAPDTWEQTAAGPSTMAPYPGGIFVDAQGVIQQTVGTGSGDPLPAIKQLLRSRAAADAAGDNRDWTAPAPLRCVSLRRLAAELVRLRSVGLPMPPSVHHLAGINDVRYLFIDRQDGDAWLVGPVGGIDLSGGWPRDRRTGKATLELPYLTATLRAALDRKPLGCSIDPSVEGISAAWDVAHQIREDIIPLADAAERLSAALGRQHVTVFGTAADTPLAWLLVEADRHMKQLALGQQAMPEGVPNYLDMVDAQIADGPPGDGQLLRMWFTTAPIAVRADAERTVFQLSGLPLRLATENQVAGRQGRRQRVADDPRAAEFADQFNEHFPAIAAKYPVYAALASVFRTAGIAALLHQHAGPMWVQRTCGPLLDETLIWPTRVPAPRQVASIAVAHHVRYAGRHHHVLVASGGVSVDPQAVIGTSIGAYPSLRSARPSESHRPAALQRWWWDVRSDSGLQ